ncbi:MAG: hypothetical protein N2746_08955 [Deltaproteobacteria bacterium]|nr:hypothetical protein [Deltaproteobacteria bacterium]
MRIFIVISICWILLSACPKKQDTTTQNMSSIASEQTGRSEVDGLPSKSFDINGDNKPDIWEYYKKGEKDGKQIEIIVRKEFDLNHDSKIDMVKVFNEKGETIREMIDFDFDGRFDTTNFIERGQLTKQEMDLNWDGKPDIMKFFEKGRIVRKELSTKINGKMDYFEYYDEKGSVDRIGIDKNGDGDVDQWIKKQ